MIAAREIKREAKERRVNVAERQKGSSKWKGKVVTQTQWCGQR